MPWKKISSETVFSAYGRSVKKKVFEMPDGTNANFYVNSMPQSACVLALTENNEVILAKQFRVGPEVTVMELPGGTIENGESPKAAIRRELIEETGYAGDIQYVTRCLDCGYNETNRYCFVATNCKKISEQTLDEHENVDVVLMSLSDFRQHIRSGRMTDVEVAYLGLDFLGLL